MDRYPEPRERPGAPVSVVTDRAPRWDSTAGFVTLADADAEVIRFAASVARIIVRARTNDALVTIAPRGRAGLRPVRVVAGTEWDAGAAGEIVSARNATAGLAADVQVVGYYACEATPTVPQDPPPEKVPAPAEY